MRLRLFFLIAIIFILNMSSCSKKSETKDQFSKYVLNTLLSDKEANDIYLMPVDSNLIQDTLLLELMRYMSKDSSYVADYKNQQEEQIKEWRERANSLNIYKSEIEYLRSEIDTLESLIGGDRKDLTVYFLVKKKEHFFKLIGVDSLNGKWVAIKIESPTNNEEQEKLKREKRAREAKEPYTPSGLYFTSGNFRYFSPTTISNFFVTLKNNTSNDFKKFRFKLTIYTNNGYSRTDVFSKTIEKNESIYAGDVFSFEILELQNYYIGVDMRNKNNFGWSGEIIDAKPRPGYEDLPY